MNLIHPARKIDFSILKVCGRFPEVIIIVYDITNNKENGDKHSPEQVNRGFGCTDLFGGCATAAQYNKGNFLSHDQGTLKFNLQFFQNFMMGIRLKITLKSTKLKTPLGSPTQGVTQATTQQPGFLHPQAALSPWSLRRHFSVTLPLPGRILPNLNNIWNR